MTDLRPDALPVDETLPDPVGGPVAEERAADELSPDEPWPTPRGPHLPDALSVLPWPAWVFILLAVARLGWALHEADFGPSVDLWRVAQVVLFGMPSIASVLFPAALLVRHPNATSRGRMLLAGAILLVVVEGLRILSEPLQPFFEGLTPGDEGVAFLVPSAVIYQTAVSLLGSFAIANIGLGLARARRYEDRSSSWPVSAGLALLVALIAVAGIVSVRRLPFDQIPMTFTIVAYLVSTVVLGVVSAVAFAYLSATSTAGARAGEDPALGWRIAAAGSWLVVGSQAALSAGGLVLATPESQPLMNTVGQVIEGTFALGFLCLLGGFLLGFPSLDPIEIEDDDNGAFDDSDAGLETGLAAPEVPGG